MLPSRSFHIAEILSVVLGYNLSQSGPRGYIALLDFLAGRRLTPAERHAYFPYAQRALREQYPEIFYFEQRDIPTLEMEPEWIRRRQQEFGEFLVIYPAHKDLQFPPVCEEKAIADAADVDQLPIPITEACLSEQVKPFLQGHIL